MRAYSAQSAGLLRLLAASVANLFKSWRRLEAEDLFLRHQLNIALRRRPPRLRLRGSDRALLVWRTRACSVWPELLRRRRSWGGIGRGSGPTGAGHHESGQGGGGDRGLRDLIQRMSVPRSMSNFRLRELAFLARRPARLQEPCERGSDAQADPAQCGDRRGGA